MDAQTNKPILFEPRDDGIGLLILNRPETHNIFSEEMIKGLFASLEELENHPNVRVIIISANGRNFSAGADLERMRKMSAASEEENYEDALQLARVLKGLSQLSKPTIALAHGCSYGGGLGLIACSDIVISADDATFCFSEVKLGLIPAMISPYIIASIGSRHARYYFLTAEVFDAPEAKRIGLVHNVVPDTILMDTGIKLATSLLRNGPYALASVKKLLGQFQNIDEDMIKMTSRWNAKMRKSSEGQEGVKAFFEKRLPNWVENK